MTLTSRFEKLERDVTELKRQLRKLEREIPKHVGKALDLNRDGIATKTKKALSS